MDALLACALEEIAAEGPSGCPLRELWAHLEAASRRHLGTPLAEDQSSRECLWRRLLGCSAVAALTCSPVAGAVPYTETRDTTAGVCRPGTGLHRTPSVSQEPSAGAPPTLPFPHLLSLGRNLPVPASAPPALAGASPSPGAPSPGKKRKGAAPAPVLATPSGAGHNGSSRYRILGGSPGEAREGPGDMPWGVQWAEQAGMVLVASPALRRCAMGLYEEVALEGGLSEPMVHTLQHLAKARQRGVSQAQLARELRIKNNNFHYVLRSLESRGLIVSHEMISRDAATGTPCRTNIVHLARYARLVQLKEQQRFEECQGPAADAPQQQQAQPGAPALEVLDDLPALALICRHLQEAQGHVLVRAELKASLGYRFTPGHRAWRRLQRKLEATGMADVFEASVDGKVVTCVRLLREWDEAYLRRSLEQGAKSFPPSASEAGDGNGRSPTEEGAGPGDGAVQGEEGGEEAEEEGSGEQLLAELCVEQQIVDLVEATGAEGVLQAQLASRIGVPKKKFYRQVAALVEAKVLLAEPESHNRSTVYRLKVPHCAAAPRGAAPGPGAEGGQQGSPFGGGDAPAGPDNGAPAVVRPPSLAIPSTPAASSAPCTDQQGQDPREPLAGPLAVPCVGAAAGDEGGVAAGKGRGRGRGTQGRGQGPRQGRGGRGRGTPSGLEESPAPGDLEGTSAPRDRVGGRARGGSRAPVSDAEKQGSKEDPSLPVGLSGSKSGQEPGEGAFSVSLPSHAPGAEGQELQAGAGGRQGHERPPLVPPPLPAVGADGAGQKGRAAKEKPRRAVRAPALAPTGVPAAATLAERTGPSEASLASSAVPEGGVPGEVRREGDLKQEENAEGRGAPEQGVGAEEGGEDQETGGAEEGGGGEGPAAATKAARRRKFPRDEKLIRRREEIILDYLKEHRVAARWEVYKRIREAESEAWAAGAATRSEGRRHTMDRKTLERLLEGLRERRLLQRAVVAVPGATNGGVLRNLDLLLAPDAAVTEDSVAALLAKHRQAVAGEHAVPAQGSAQEQQQQRQGGGAERPQGALPREGPLSFPPGRGGREGGAGVKKERVDTPESAAVGAPGARPEQAAASQPVVPVLVGVERRLVGRQMDALRRREKVHFAEGLALLGTPRSFGGGGASAGAILDPSQASDSFPPEPRLVARLPPGSGSFGAQEPKGDPDSGSDGQRLQKRKRGAVLGAPGGILDGSVEGSRPLTEVESGEGRSRRGRGGLPREARARAEDSVEGTRKAVGYVVARMVRARLLHLCLWDRACNPPAPQQGGAAAEAGKGNPARHPLAFVLEAFILSLPLHSFLQILGVSSPRGIYMESLERRAIQGCTLADLPAGERAQLWDQAARKRASLLLRILLKLGVVSLVWRPPDNVAPGAGAAQEEEGAETAAAKSATGVLSLPRGSDGALRQAPGEEGVGTGKDAAAADEDGGAGSLVHKLEREVRLQHPDTVDLFVHGRRASAGPFGARPSLGTHHSSTAGRQGDQGERRKGVEEGPSLVLLPAMTRSRDGSVRPGGEEGALVGAEQGVVRRSVEGAVVTLVWDAQTEPGLRSYWAALQLVFTRLQPALAAALFPACAVPDVMQARMWSSTGLMTIQQRRDLTLRLEILEGLRQSPEGQPQEAQRSAPGGVREAEDDEGEERRRIESRLASLLFQRKDARAACESIARELGLSVSQVTTAMYQRNAKRRYMVLHSAHQALGPGAPSPASLASDEGASMGQWKQAVGRKRPPPATWEDPLLRVQTGAGAGGGGGAEVEPRWKVARGGAKAHQPAPAQRGPGGLAAAARGPRGRAGSGVGAQAHPGAAQGGAERSSDLLDEGEEEGEEEGEFDDEDEDEEEEGEEEDWGARQEGGEAGAGWAAGREAGLGSVPVRGRRVVWTEVATRMLLEAYSCFRAVHKKMVWVGQLPQMLVLEERTQPGEGGAGGSASLAVRAHENALPHPPRACRRHMAALRSDPGTRRAISTLCALIARRYERWQAWARARYQLQQQQDQGAQGAGDSRALVVHPGHSDEALESRAELGSGLRPMESVGRAGMEGGGTQGQKRQRRGRGEVDWESSTPWDDFSDPAVRAALDRVLHSHYSLRPWLARRRFSGRQLSRTMGPQQTLSAGAPPGCTSGPPQGMGPGASGRRRGTEASEEEHGDRAQPGSQAEEAEGGIPRVSVGVAVSCASELIQAVVLNTSPSGEFPEPLVQCLRGFSNAQVVEAFHLLRTRNILVPGKGTKTYDLNPSLLGSASPALVPTHAWLDAAEADAWARDAAVERALEEEGTLLPSTLRFGHALRFLSLAAHQGRGAWRLEPVLPLDPASIGESPGGGDASDVLGSLVPHQGMQRRVRGFPGLAVRLCRVLRDPARLLSTLEGLPGADFPGEGGGEGDALLASAAESALQGDEAWRQPPGVLCLVGDGKDSPMEEDDSWVYRDDASGSTHMPRPGAAGGAPGSPASGFTSSFWPAASASLWDLSASEQHSLLQELNVPAQSGSANAGTLEAEGPGGEPRGVSADGAAKTPLVAFLRQVLGVVRAQGDAGCPLPQLQAVLGAQGTPGSGVAVEEAVAWLVSFELLAQVSGDDAVYFLAPEHASRLFFTAPQPVEAPGLPPPSRQPAGVPGPASPSEQAAVDITAEPLPEGRGATSATEEEGTEAPGGPSDAAPLPAVTGQGAPSLAPAQGVAPGQGPGVQEGAAEASEGCSATIARSEAGTAAGIADDAAGEPGGERARGTEGARQHPQSMAADRGSEGVSHPLAPSPAQGGLGCPIRPWLCPDGSTHKEFLRSLCRRVVGLIFTLPGVSQEMLLELVPALSPQTCGDVLAMLEADKAIRVRSCMARPITSHPPSLLRPRSARKKGEVAEQGLAMSRRSEHYFLGSNYMAWM